MELARPLLEYLRLKELAGELSDRPLLGRDVFSRLPSQDLPAQFQGEEPLLHVNLFQLIDAFKKLLDQRVPGVQLQFRMEKWSVQDKMNFILEKLKTQGAQYFHELFENDRTVAELIVTFLAILELVQMGLLKIFQNDPMADVRIDLSAIEEADHE